jgi:hypothetical protein
VAQLAASGIRKQGKYIMAGPTSSTNPNPGQSIPLHDINTHTNTNPNAGEGNTTSAASPHISVASSALSHPHSRTSSPHQTTSAAPGGVLPASQTHAMVSAEVPTRVHALYDPRRAAEHFFPPAPANVDQLLAEYETAYRQVKESRPVNEASFRAFQAKRQNALQLEHQAALATHRADLLSASAKMAESLQDFKSKAVWQGAKDFADAIGTLIPATKVHNEAAQAQKAAKALHKQVSAAWDEALVDYLDAHNLDRGALKSGNKRAGTRYALRVVPPAILGLASTAFGLIPADSVAGKFYVSLGSLTGVLALAGVVVPTSYAASTLTSVTWSDALFDHAADIQNLLKTPMVEAVAQRLIDAHQSAEQAQTDWRAVRNDPPGEAREAAWTRLQTAQHELKEAQFDFLMRVDLNRVYVQGFEDQGIANGVKYGGNLSVGPISAATSASTGWLTQAGIAAGHFAVHMGVSGDDEDSKQTRMLYLRMRACDIDLGPEAGPDRDEEQVSAGLETFSNEIRSPHRVRQNALKEILSKDLRTIENDIAAIVDLPPNDIKALAQWKEFQAAGAEANDMPQAERDRGAALDALVNSRLPTKSPEDVEKYHQLMSARSEGAADIEHVDKGAFSQVSDRNKAMVYYGVQVTAPSKGFVGTLKSAVSPVSPEFRLGMTQGASRISRPEEWLTTLGLAYWASFQLAICGENGPLILSKIVNFIMAADALRRNEHISKEANVGVQSGLAAFNLAVSLVLMWASAKVIDMALQPQKTREWANRFAAGRSSAANTVYLGALLNRRDPHRDEQKRTAPDAGFQQVGMGALKSKNYWSELKKTLWAGMADLAKEAPSAGKARDGYIAAAVLEEAIQADIDLELNQRLPATDDAPPDYGDTLGIEGLAVDDEIEEVSTSRVGESSKQMAAPEQTKTQPG